LQDRLTESIVSILPKIGKTPKMKAAALRGLLAAAMCVPVDSPVMSWNKVS
jgi:hypothetical protein